MRNDILNSSSGKFADEIVVNANHVEYHSADVTLNAVQDVGGVYIGVTGAKKGACIKLEYGSADGWFITHLSAVDNWTHES
jgi:hypothetical protein